MNRRRIRTQEVLVHLGVEESGFIDALRAEGLFVEEEIAPEQAEDLRLAKLLVEELGVNAPGVDVALHLRRRLLALERRARRLAALLEASRD